MAQPEFPPSGTLGQRAYDLLEAMIVCCTLKPGQLLSIGELQDRTGLGRTPIHQAVGRLAADTLILVRPRHGLQVAPVDPVRERILLVLRRDLERFALRLAAERANPGQRAALRLMSSTLRQEPDRIDIAAFNGLDRQMDALIARAAAEPFLERTLRPLHTLFRRVGWIYHSVLRPHEGLGRTLACHLEVLDAVADGRVDGAVAAADRLVDFVLAMVDLLQQDVDPALLDCRATAAAAA